MIDTSIEKAMAFATKKYGDTPTDALQLVPKKYVSSVVGSFGPGGSSGNIQYNNGAGGFGGSSILTLSSLSAPELDFQGVAPVFNVFGSTSAVVETQTVAGSVAHIEAAGTSADMLLSSFQPFIKLVNTATGGSNYFVETVAQQTTNNSPTTMFTYVASGASANDTIYIEAKVVAKRTGGSAGTAADSAAYVRRAAFKLASTAVVQVGATQDAFTVEDQAGWDVGIRYDGANIIVEVTGATNNNINWGGQITIIENL